MVRPLKLGVFSHGLLQGDGRRTVTRSTSLLFLKGLRDYGFKIRSLCSSVEYQSQPLVEEYPINVEEEDIELYPLPTWHYLTEQIRVLPFQIKEVKAKLGDFVGSCDLLWVRAPTLLLGMILRESRRQGKPLVVHMAGNIRSGWRSKRYPGVLKIIGRILGEIIYRRDRKLLTDQIVLATGPELVRMFSKSNRKGVIPFVDSLVQMPTNLYTTRDYGQNLLFVGRVSHGKGLFSALKALKSVRKNQPEVTLSIVGEGPLVGELKSEACKLGVADAIQWKGFIPYGEKLNKTYQEADVLVIPSEATEGFPRVMLEAWANGVLVIGSRVGGLAHLIKDCKNGLLAEPGDFKSLSEAILRLTKEPALRARLLKGGYSSLEPYTYQRQLKVAAQALKEAYQST